MGALSQIFQCIRSMRKVYQNWLGTHRLATRPTDETTHPCRLNYDALMVLGRC